MNRIRFSIVALLVALGSSAPLSAGAAPPSHTGAKPTSAPDAAPVNINTADVKELMKLEGVGRRVAEKIVEYRDTHGPFKKPEELRKVEGVGNGLWERNRTRIVIK
jgi:competence ComEA-like helix-hairpin-helix protein